MICVENQKRTGFSIDHNFSMKYSRSSGNFDLARAYNFLFIANLIQNAINQNDMRGKPKKNRLFD